MTNPGRVDRTPALSENEQVRQVITRLRAEIHPSVATTSAIEDYVRAAWATFNGARVRTYIPVLVERNVRDWVRTHLPIAD
jgi:hypothetical protein